LSCVILGQITVGFRLRHALSERKAYAAFAALGAGK